MTGRDRFLAKIDEVTPWTQLHQLIEPFYPKVEGAGRPPVRLARMLRMYVAQQCFGRSDEGIEDAIYDSQAIRGSVGIDLNGESAPDATTLLKFRRLLEKHELTRKMMMREGTIVDATLIAAPPSTKNKTAGVRNMFDRNPPLSYQTETFQAGYDPRYSDPIGRTFYVRGTYSF